MIGVELGGLADLRSELRRIDIDYALGGAYQETQKDVVSQTRRNIAGLDIPRRALAASGVVGGVSQGAGFVELEQSNPIVRAAVLGTRWHQVFGRPVRAESMIRPVFPRWIGRNWKPERDPHALAEAIDTNDIADDWLEAVFKELKKVFDE